MGMVMRGLHAAFLQRKYFYTYFSSEILIFKTGVLDPRSLRKGDIRLVKTKSTAASKVINTAKYSKVNTAKPNLRMKEIIGHTQTNRQGLELSKMEWWSKTKGKAKRDMVIQEIRDEEDNMRLQKAVQQSQQGQWTSWKALYKEVSHGMTCGTWPH